MKLLIVSTATIIACGVYSVSATEFVPNPYADVDPRLAFKELQTSLGSIGPDYMGAHPYFNDDVMARFLDSTRRGAWNEVRALEPEACVRWRHLSPNVPITGNGSIYGVEISLNKLCGIKP
jgi:hypothetical protein